MCHAFCVRFLNMGHISTMFLVDKFALPDGLLLA